jgi:hypothetical protein
VITTSPTPAAASIRHVAEALLARYPSAPAAETETAIAVLALWALDAIDAGRLAPQDADQIFTLLEVETSEARGGPELSDTLDQLMLEGMALHDWGTVFAGDTGRMRSLALAILQAAG